MLDPEHKRIVESYIAARTWALSPDGLLRKQEDSDWAQGALYDAVWEQPRLGWALIREISRAAQSDEIYRDLANGPLHQLLVEHPEIMDEIETDAKSDGKVRTLLSHFWQDNALPDALKQRIARASHPQH
jgi:hypothetical protein